MEFIPTTGGIPTCINASVRAKAPTWNPWCFPIPGIGFAVDWTLIPVIAGYLDPKR